MNTDCSAQYYRTQIMTSLSQIGQAQWDGLLSHQAQVNPFVSYAFLDALHESGSASAKTGWTPHYLSLWQADELVAAMPLYKKSHSYGEYVFDWAWADAYHQHGLDYYPKLLSAIPFTPVSGNRLLAKDSNTRAALIIALKDLLSNDQYSSIHILFPPKDEAATLEQAGFLLRKGIQFHWINRGYEDFEDFLSSLEHKKRKNIRAERRKVAQAGVKFRHISGEGATKSDWEFFKRCYDQTYAEHHSSPYLTLDFFMLIGATMPQNIHLIVAEIDAVPIASSLLIYDQERLYGRYWGSLKHVPCLHFETAYYQSIEFCIAQNIALFEGGAQGEHKMARGFLPVETYSCHFLAEPLFYDAVARFLARETDGIEHYVTELEERNPFRAKIAP